MAGSIVNPKRPRYQANERFDTVDADAQSRAPREQSKAVMRAFGSAPRATAGNPSVVGMIVTGFELTLNPINGTDGKVRVSSNVGVAIDADGGVIIKPQGTTVDITIPTGTFQLYAYYNEDPTDNAKRRFLSVTSPFVESTISINTSFQGTCSFTAVSGNAASVVPEAVVNGVTTPFCCIGIVTNGGTGAITCTGYDAVNAPNGTDIAGRLSVPELTSSPPLSPFVNGSIRSVTEMLKQLAYHVGQLGWKGSNQTPPTFANNRMAYVQPVAGIDPTNRNLPGVFTIGNGSTTFGDFDTTSFGNAKLLLDAVYAALPSNGGTIYIKRDVALSGFGGVTSPIPAGKHVTFVGVGNPVAGAGVQITLASGESFTAGANSNVTFQGLSISWVGNVFIADTSASNTSSVTFMDCAFVKPSGTDSGAAISASGGSVVNDVTLVRCKASITLTAGSANGMLVRLAQVARRVSIRDVSVTMGNKECSVFSFTDMRNDVVIQNVSVEDPGATTSTATAGVGVIVANSTSNTDAEGANRHFKNITSRCAGVPLLFLGSAGYVTLESSTYAPPGNTPAVVATAHSGAGPVVISGGRMTSFSIVTAAGAGPSVTLIVKDVASTQAGSAFGSTAWASFGTTVAIQRCVFTPAGVGSPVTVSFSGIGEVLVEDCKFDGVNHTTTSGFACVDCVGAGGGSDTIRRVFIRRNLITNFQNIVFAGSASSVHRMFAVKATFINRVMCTDNLAFNIMRSSTGVSRFGAFLLELKSPAGGSSAMLGDEFVVSNNVVGGNTTTFDDDCVGLLSVPEYSRINHVAVKNNIVRQGWMSDVATINLLTPNTIEFVSTFPTATTINQLQVEGNQMYMEGQNAGGGTMPNMDTEFLHITGTAQVDFAGAWSIQDNQLIYGVTASGNMSFNGTTALGMRLNNNGGVSPVGLVIKHNVVALKGTTVGATAFKIQTGGGAVTIPSLPAVNSAFADNIGIVRG